MAVLGVATCLFQAENHADQPPCFSPFLVPFLAGAGVHVGATVSGPDRLGHDRCKPAFLCVRVGVGNQNKRISLSPSPKTKNVKNRTKIPKIKKMEKFLLFHPRPKNQKINNKIKKIEKMLKLRKSNQNIVQTRKFSTN